MKKFDLAVAVEVTGAALVAAGLAMIFVPASLIVLGSFLIWLTEKAN